MPKDPYYLGIDPEADMYRICSRCKVKVFHRDPEHICKDVRRRYDREEKQIKAVMTILEPGLLADRDIRTVAEIIVVRLKQMGIHDDT